MTKESYQGINPLMLMDFKAVVDFGVPFLLYKSVPHKISIIEDNRHYIKNSCKSKSARSFQGA